MVLALQANSCFEMLLQTASSGNLLIYYIFLFALMQKETKKSRQTRCSAALPCQRLPLCNSAFSFITFYVILFSPLRSIFLAGILARFIVLDAVSFGLQL